MFLSLGIHFIETFRQAEITSYIGGRGKHRLRPDLSPLIPGFYADAQGRLYLNMGEFLSAYGYRIVRKSGS